MCKKVIDFWLKCFKSGEVQDVVSLKSFIWRQVQDGLISLNPLLPPCHGSLCRQQQGSCSASGMRAGRETALAELDGLVGGSGLAKAALPMV